VSIGASPVRRTPQGRMARTMMIAIAKAPMTEPIAVADKPCARP
jgi:hypothetical protein